MVAYINFRLRTSNRGGKKAEGRESLSGSRFFLFASQFAFEKMIADMGNPFLLRRNPENALYNFQLRDESPSRFFDNASRSRDRPDRVKG